MSLSKAITIIIKLFMNTVEYAEIIPNKLTGEILAVYHQYEGDHTKPFSYFIGCKVKADTEVPPGLETLTIAKGT